MEDNGYEPILQDHAVASPAIERRLTLRLLAYWERIRGDRAMPNENDINPEGDISDMWDDCFLIHTQDIDKEGYNFIFVGNNLKMVLTGGMFDDPADMWKSLNVRHLAPDLKKVLETQKPVIHEGELVNDAGQLVKYRQCLLPVGENNKVLAIFGGMRCKIYA